jgi:hypothetical protein
MTGTALRQELHAFIDTIPERRLTALRPLLADLATDDNDYWKPVIEPASPEEIAMIKEGVQEYRDHPENFISLADYMAGDRA